MTPKTNPHPREGVCMDCNCTLTDENAYDDTICVECYAAELEGEAMEDELS